MEEPKPVSLAGEPGHSIKRDYVTPRLTDFGSVETLSLSGTQVKGESPASSNRSKKP
jgi:hypothetical protein